MKTGSLRPKVCGILSLFFHPPKNFKQSRLDLYFTTIIMENSIKEILEGRGDQRQGDKLRVT